MSEVKKTSEKKNTIVEKVSDAFVKVYGFAKAHPVLTMIVSNVAIAGVSYGIGMAINRNQVEDAYNDGFCKALDGENYVPENNYRIRYAEGGTCDIQDKAIIEAGGHANSEKVLSIIRGIDQMKLESGDGLYVTKDNDEWFTARILEINPDFVQNFGADIDEQMPELID